MKAKKASKMNEEQAMQGQIADQMLNENIDLDKALDDLLEKNNVQVDENSDEPVVFEYTNREVKEMIVGGRVSCLLYTSPSPRD